MAPKIENKQLSKKSGFFKGVQTEWKKIVWPTKKQLINYSIAVILISIITSMVIGGLDFVLRSLMKFVV